MDKKRLKIAILCRGYGTVHRGVETFVGELSNRLKKNHEVIIFSGKEADSFKSIFSSNFDIVMPTNGRLQALKVFLGKLLKGYKTVIAGQAGIGKDDIWNILITHPDVYVALTDYELDWARKWAFLGVKLVKIPNGVDLNIFTKVTKKQDLGLERPIILSVGALEWYKHHDRSIKAVSRLEKGSLLIVGKGPEKERLLKIGNNLLGNNRFMIKSVDFGKIPELYRQSDLFVLPSWIRESFGIVYVEAMASGLAVVAPNDPPRKEIIGDAGVFVNVEDENDYAFGIKKALSIDWKNKPRKQAEIFNWDNIAKSYEKLFQEITK